MEHKDQTDNAETAESSPPIDFGVFAELCRLDRNRLAEPLSAVAEWLPESFAQDVAYLDNLVPLEEIKRQIDVDTFPLPAAVDREGYWAKYHFHYWLSGLVDSVLLEQAVKRFATDRDGLRYLDLGCASGRVLRHLALRQSNWDIHGSEIDPMHIAWIRQYLPLPMKVLLNTVLPHFPFEDNHFDVISGFSVLTHADHLEDALLYEIRRVLKPGGIAYITAHTDHTWATVKESMPGFADHLIEHSSGPHIPPDLTPNAEMFDAPPPAKRVVLRWSTKGAYIANTWHTTEYIRKVWGSIFEIVECRRPTHRQFQDIIILKKPANG